MIDWESVRIGFMETFQDLCPDGPKELCPKGPCKRCPELRTAAQNYVKIITGVQHTIETLERATKCDIMENESGAMQMLRNDVFALKGALAVLLWVGTELRTNDAMAEMIGAAMDGKEVGDDVSGAD